MASHKLILISIQKPWKFVLKPENINYSVLWSQRCPLNTIEGGKIDSRLVISWHGTLIIPITNQFRIHTEREKLQSNVNGPILAQLNAISVCSW